MNTRKSKTNHISMPGMVTTVIVLGSIWGLTEALAGGAMRAAFPPLRAALCTGIGMGILGFGIGIKLPRRFIPAAAIASAATMMLAVPILHCSPLCRANSALAVILHGTMLAVFIPPAWARGGGSLPGFCAAGFSAALISSVLFHYFGLHLAPCQYLLSFAGEFGAARFILREGLPWAAFSGALLPLGVTLGRRYAGRIAQIRDRAPGLFYAATVSSVALCLAVISMSIR